MQGLARLRKPTQGLKKIHPQAFPASLPSQTKQDQSRVKLRLRLCCAMSELRTFLRRLFEVAQAFLPAADILFCLPSDYLKAPGFGCGPVALRLGAPAPCVLK